MAEIVQLERNSSLRGIIGDGNNVADFLYIDNSAYAHLLAAEAMQRQSSTVPGKVYSIGNGEPVPVWAVLQTLFGMMGESEAFGVRAS